MSRQAQIGAVTFDVGGTLIEPWPSVGHIYCEVAARSGVSGLSVDLLNQRFSAAWERLKHFNYTRAEWSQLVDETFHGLTQTVPSRTFFSELYSHFGRAQSWRIFEDVFETLDALASQQLRLGLISNWDERLRPLLGELGLDQYFEAIIISSDVGFCKPSPVIFEEAAAKLGLPPGRILHVGDSPAADIEGAKAAGFQTTELRREAPGVSNRQINTLRLLISLINPTH
jgi:putative hydrolase of the HAD superfamily